MDGSKRSKHSNAYFTGLGRVKRIVLFDTLVSQMSEDEVLAVLAHEIGHEKKRHVFKGTILSIVLSFLAFWVLDRFMGWESALRRLRLRGPPSTRCSSSWPSSRDRRPSSSRPAFSAWSRKHEYAADAFAGPGAAGHRGPRGLVP